MAADARKAGFVAKTLHENVSCCLWIGDWEVVASRACAFVLRSYANGTIGASASIPDEGGQLRLAVRVNRPHGAGATSEHDDDAASACVLEFALGTGDALGQSVAAPCR
eukprot:COSAG06_NODE_17842_length_918_cov_1.459096_2_plen_109_part_00